MWFFVLSDFLDTVMYGNISRKQDLEFSLKKTCDWLKTEHESNHSLLIIGKFR